MKMVVDVTVWIIHIFSFTGIALLMLRQAFGEYCTAIGFESLSART
jgi:hypothetical protein